MHNDPTSKLGWLNNLELDQRVEPKSFKPGRVWVWPITNSLCKHFELFWPCERLLSQSYHQKPNLEGLKTSFCIENSSGLVHTSHRLCVLKWHERISLNKSLMIHHMRLSRAMLLSTHVVFRQHTEQFISVTQNICIPVTIKIVFVNK